MPWARRPRSLAELAGLITKHQIEYVWLQAEGSKIRLWEARIAQRHSTAKTGKSIAEACQAVLEAEGFL